MFGAGTVQWTWGLDDFHDSPNGIPAHLTSEYCVRVGRDLSGVDPTVQQASVNLFARMGAYPETPADNIVVSRTLLEDLEPPDAPEFVEAQDGVVTLRVCDVGGVVAAVEAYFAERWRPLDILSLEGDSCSLWRWRQADARKADLVGDERVSDNVCNTGTCGAASSRSSNIPGVTEAAAFRFRAVDDSGNFGAEAVLNVALTLQS